MNPQYYSDHQKDHVRQSLVLVLVLVFGFLVYETVSAYFLQRSTGLLIVTASAAQATISVSQTRRQATIVGQGSSRVRLQPGDYVLAASKNGYQSTASVHITQKQTTKEFLQLTKAVNATDSANKIYSLLPFQGPSAAYKIDATTANEAGHTEPVLLITYTDEKSKQDALDWIRSQGFDPGNYTIQYQNQPLTNYHYINGLPPQ